MFPELHHLLTGTMAPDLILPVSPPSRCRTTPMPPDAAPFMMASLVTPSTQASGKLWIRSPTPDLHPGGIPSLTTTQLATHCLDRAPFLPEILFQYLLSWHPLKLTKLLKSSL